MILNDEIDIYGFNIRPNGQIEYLAGIYTLTELLNSTGNDNTLVKTAPANYRLEYDGSTITYYVNGTIVKYCRHISIQDKAFRFHVLNIYNIIPCTNIWVRYNPDDLDPPITWNTNIFQKSLRIGSIISVSCIISAFLYFYNRYKTIVDINKNPNKKLNNINL
jgi:hypothetical protein